MELRLCLDVFLSGKAWAPNSCDAGTISCLDKLFLAECLQFLDSFKKYAVRTLPTPAIRALMTLRILPRLAYPP